ncbi:mitochondrial enolase superfamily member 1 [Grus japonensis]|uniref:Mitochondrial enolase superfamily member 1 n=1 Tax=Grus japonensis TaxID=30415 RepID=A0ABC9Y7U4_GRUJA
MLEQVPGRTGGPVKRGAHARAGLLAGLVTSWGTPRWSSLLLKWSQRLGEFSEDSKRENVTLIFKNSRKKDTGHQRVVISGTKSSWRQVSGDVPYSSILDPILFKTFINDLDDGTEYILGKFVSNTKLRGVSDAPYGCAAIKRDLDRVEKWADRNLMKFNKGKCKALHLGRISYGHQYMVGLTIWKSVLQKSSLGS